ncbi:S8 family serine peptidase [Roseateles sp.]|uniref:S8 family serine peptidase n=1 Tax=Roseateles sp. TaxID=1971397 RepID=UPI0032636A66
MKMKLKPAALATLVLLSGLATSSFAQDRKTYIVQLKDEPAVSYQGTVPGLTATQPAAGEPFRFGSAAVQAYISYLSQQQSNVISLVGNAPVLVTYKNVFNGFAASLTDAEARTLSSSAQVVALWEDEARRLDTISTSKFLGLTAPGGLWSQTAGGSAIKGENLVIGVVDLGIWPENPAFFDRVDDNGVPVKTGGTLAFGPAPASFLGGCVAGEGIDPAKHCNNKLIGIKHFNAGFIASGKTPHWTSFASGRDDLGGATGHGGHGDHTASTAAGNSNVTAIVNGISLGQASGMAPRARVAAYKVCYTYIDPTATDGTGTANSCFNSDTVAGIDQAVADGVNVINYSISGAQTTVNDPVEQAFYRASLAGIFVAASAGNSGPGTAVAHISPWLTTVAASTHDRAFSADVTLGNAAKYTGASLNQTALSAKPLIRAEDAGIAGASSNLNLCFSNPLELDPAKVNGKIVICTRGNNARVDKSLAVANAGGVGMILADNGGGLVAEAHSVPTVHVSTADGNAVKAYALATGASATASIGKFYLGTAPAPIMANFSSRGPNGGDSNVLKPDLTAPGVDVIAQVSPALSQADRDAVAAGTLVPGPEWASYQGTSMSSPHVAGVALLLKQAHPTWSPAAIKSALMTTAYSTLNDGLSGLSNGQLPWSQGAGHIDPNKATDPGLVYNAGKNDWVKYQCKVNKPAVLPASDCTTIGTLNETYELNLPSITVGTVVGSVTVPRTVTNVGTAAATYTATASVPGFTTVVTPLTLNLAPGASGSFTVKLTATTAVEGVWNYGQLVWNDGTHNVRSPIQAKVGKAITAPAEATATTTSGTRLMTVRTGFAGRMGSKVGGFKDVTMGDVVTLSPAELSSAQLKAACQAGVTTASTKVYNFSIPAGAIVARFALRSADVGAAGDDNDMMLLYPNNTTSVYSGTDGSNEAVQVTAPAGGNYKVCVTAWGGGETMSHKLSSWIVNPGDGGTLRVATPAAVYAGSTATVGATWSGLVTGKRYVGGFQLTDLSGTPQSTTVLRVSTDGSVPVQNEPVTISSKVAAEAAQ